MATSSNSAPVSDQHNRDDSGQSVYKCKPTDPKAVYLKHGSTDQSLQVGGDDGTALQAAIDQVAQNSGPGIVFLPEGTYRLTKTLNIWRGIRLIGYGNTRPTLKLEDHSHDFQKGEGKYLIHFCHIKPKGNEPVQDANNNTFFSGISNINIDLGTGNPAAVAVRFHVSQNSFLEHIDFSVNASKGAIEEIGNLIEDCKFFGGDWAIKTGNTAPGWPVTILDCNFEGQRLHSIITADAGMTVIRCKFRNSPNGIQVPFGNEQLFVKDSWFENIEKTAININNYYNPETQINFENIGLSHVPSIIRFAVTYGIIASPPEDALHFKAISPVCNVKSFSHGLHISKTEGKAPERKFATFIDQRPVASLGQFPVKDLPGIPQPQTWKNIAELGAIGNGHTDCTDIFKQAIDQFQIIYVPTGKYLISETLELHDSTVIIGLHPALTQLVLRDSTSDFSDSLKMKPLLVAPEGGKNIISGIGLDLRFNPGAIGIKWMADSVSYVNDLFFVPGNRHRKIQGLGMGQSYGLWVTNRGGGTFKNIWAPNDFSRCPFYVNNTDTPGRIYEVSLEHHKNVELKLKDVRNWEFYALQTEENLGGEQALPVFVENCSQIKFANLLCYRIAAISVPFPSAIKLHQSDRIKISGMHVYSSGPFPFDHAIVGENSGMVVSNLKFTSFTNMNDD